MNWVILQAYEERGGRGKQGRNAGREGQYTTASIPPRVNYVSFLKISRRNKHMNLNSHIPSVNSHHALIHSSGLERIQSLMNAMWMS